MLKRIATISLALVLLAQVPMKPAISADVFTAGVSSYNARRYPEALGYFRQAAAARPNDGLLHYYMGLAYQGMNQMSLARQEYTFVTTHPGNAQLRSQASLALSNLSHYSTTYSGYSAPAQSTPAPKTASAPERPRVVGRLKVMYFTMYT